ncbi:unnamed protein product [Adineta steineri]|uniref:Uncharacterized protein n=1 Tax=Adineta steineri TaxID=433720 RepID=A0A815M4L8_9BILA|nr:unnamed protein product [Adineta steineri]
MTERDTDIFCSFCNEPFTSTEDIGNHLMMCGNKTDPCPRCNQFIRRAIFAYHYENNCAILDEITTRDKTYQTPQNSGGIIVTIKCNNCHQNYDKTRRQEHQENCIYNPANIEENQHFLTYDNPNHNINQTNQFNNLDDGNILIPCEYCYKGISWEHYKEHIENNTSKRFISCSFCDEKLPSSSLGEHLMMCGNKTDECPRCKKFIRRAVYAYHYENNCANLDNLDNDTNDTTIQPNASTTFQRTTSLESTNGHNKHITIVSVDISPYSTTSNVSSSQLNSDFCAEKKITTECLYCYEQCEISERLLHQDNCLKNPDNIAKKQQSKINTNSNSSTDQWNHPVESDNNDNIPCEMCNEEVKWCNYVEHTRACTEREREDERKRNETRAYDLRNVSRLVQCKYCNEQRFESVITIHEAACRAAASHRYYNNMFHLPPFPF